MPTEAEKLAHRDAVLSKINAKFVEMRMSYDSKCLAISHLVEGTKLFRAILSAGLWDEQEVKIIVEEALSGLFDKYEQPPQVCTFEMPEKPS